MKFYKFFSIFLLIPFFAFTLHQYYISLCEIEYVEEKESIQIIIGFFIDDLELSINNENEQQLDFFTKSKATDSLCMRYLGKHLKVSVNQEFKPFDFIGKEFEDDIVRFYLEINNIEYLNSIEITNTALIQYFDKQKNIVKIKTKEMHNTYYLDYENTKCLLKL